MTHFEWFIVGIVLLFISWRLFLFSFDVTITLKRMRRNNELKEAWRKADEKLAENLARMQSERESDKK